MKVLFLDVDGVINTYTTCRHNRDMTVDCSEEDCMLCPILVQRVQWICDATGASLVLSSSWRSAYTVPEMNKLLGAAGMRTQIIDATPHLDPERGRCYANRGEEIRGWLDDHPEVTNFVVLDDCADANVPDHFVHTNSDVGITKANVDRAIVILQGNHERPSP